MSMTHSFRTDPISPLVSSTSETQLTQLAQRIEGYIEEKASGRIRDLHVECFEDQIVLEGRSRTYHAKQLAQEAALDLADGALSLSNNIVVR